MRFSSYKNWCDVKLVEKWAKRFTELGFQCVALVYRTPRPVGLPIYQTAWQDGQRAVRLVRSQAKKRGFDPEKIGEVVGQRGKTINAIIDQTGVKIDITDEGFISICGTEQAMMDKAAEMIKIITTEFEEGQIFKGKVISIKEFGAFVEFAPGKEGMVHISKIAKERINHVEDVLTLGDKVKCICLGKDKMGRISFSMKDVAQQ